MAGDAQTPWTSVPLLERVRERGSAEPAARAVVFSSVAAPEPLSVTYAELTASAEMMAKSICSLLASAGPNAPRHVAFLVEPSIAYVTVELGIWAAGAVAVPLSVHSPAPELEYFLTQSEAYVVIADEKSAAKIQPVAEKLAKCFCLVVGQESSKTRFELSGVVAGEGEQYCAPATPVENNALILYTSGTTGKPKGVVHTFSSLTAQMESLSEAWGWSPADYTLHMLPMHHIHGVQNILNTALFNGATVEFTPFDAGHCLRRLVSGDITCFHAVPTVYVKFTQHLEKLDDAGREAIRQGLRNENLRLMVCGSAALPVPTMKGWAENSGHVLLERYGMTEIGMGLGHRSVGTRYPGCVGWPMPKQEVKVDEQGNVLVRGPLVFKEYWRNPEATAKEFNEEGFFITGDNCQVGGTPEELQAYQDAAREVEASTGRPPAATAASAAEVPALAGIHKIMGRTSMDIIKSGGYKISALEIESALLQHEAIREVAVIGKPDETWGEKVTAVCILDGELTLEGLRRWAKERMATYKVPQQLDIVKELPRNQMGKLEKKKILDSYAAQPQ